MIQRACKSIFLDSNRKVLHLWIDRGSTVLEGLCCIINQSPNRLCVFINQHQLEDHQLIVLLHRKATCTRGCSHPPSHYKKVRDFSCVYKITEGVFWSTQMCILIHYQRCVYIQTFYIPQRCRCSPLTVFFFFNTSLFKLITFGRQNTFLSLIWCFETLSLDPVMIHLTKTFLPILNNGQKQKHDEFDLLARGTSLFFICPTKS